LKWVVAGLLVLPLFSAAAPGPDKENLPVPALSPAASVDLSIQDDKDKKKKDQDAKADADADKKDAGKTAATAKPEVKEVPKARPKLRPATVGDKIKIKKIPVKVKPKLIRSIGL